MRWEKKRGDVPVLPYAEDSASIVGAAVALLVAAALAWVLWHGVWAIIQAGG